MILYGLNKLTLLDYPEHLACTAFTGTCNFRCPFCYNASLVLSPSSCQKITEEEFFNFLNTRKGRLEGVCITGGEPTLQADLIPFIKKIKQQGFLVKLDTNGYNPNILSTLLSEHLLDMVAMDIKNSKEHYAKTCGIKEMDFNISAIEESIRLLLTSTICYEFRTTIVKELHDTQAIRDIGTWLQQLSIQYTNNLQVGAPYFLQSFQSTNHLICGSETMFHSHSNETLEQFVQLLRPYLPNTNIRGK